MHPQYKERQSDDLLCLSLYSLSLTRLAYPFQFFGQALLETAFPLEFLEVLKGNQNPILSQSIFRPRVTLRPSFELLIESWQLNYARIIVLSDKDVIMALTSKMLFCGKHGISFPAYRILAS
jgi:hypothetical protein